MVKMDIKFFAGPNIHGAFPAMRYQFPIKGLPRFLPADYLDSIKSLSPFADVGAFIKTHIPDAYQPLETRQILPPLFQWLLVEVLRQIYGQRPPGNVEYQPDHELIVGVSGFEDKDICRRSAGVVRQLVESTLVTDPDGKKREISVENFSAFIVRQKRAYLLGRDHQTNREYVAIAAQRNIPWRRLHQGSREIQLGYGCKQKHVRASVSDRESVIFADYANNKDQTSQILSQLGYPVARQARCITEDQILTAARGIGFPVVVKPRFGSQGYGVTPRIVSEADLVEAYHQAKKHDELVVVEKHIEGDDYRLMVIDGEFTGALHRIPPEVTANGKDSIKDLIDKLNSDPARSVGSGSGLYPVEIAPTVLKKLEKMGLSLSDIPKKNRKIRLSDLPNISQGGLTGNANERVHPDNARLAVEVAAAIGVRVAGVDFLSTDISKPYWQNGAVICEVNIQPAVNAMFVPRGEDENFYYRKMFETMFPPGKVDAIPVAVFLAGASSDSADMFVRYLKTLWRPLYKTIGIAAGSELSVADRPLTALPYGPKAAEAVLWNPSVGGAIITETTASVADNGLGYAMSDFVVISEMPSVENSTTDRAAMDLVAATARRAVIVNADDEALWQWAQDLAPLVRAGLIFGAGNKPANPEAAFRYSLDGARLTVKYEQDKEQSFQSKALVSLITSMTEAARFAFLSALTVNLLQDRIPDSKTLLAIAKG